MNLEYLHLATIIKRHVNPHVKYYTLNNSILINILKFSQLNTYSLYSLCVLYFMSKDYYSYLIYKLIFYVRLKKMYKLNFF